VTVKCRTTIKELFLYFNLCLSVKLDSLSCSFTTITFLTNLVVWDQQNSLFGSTMLTDYFLNISYLRYAVDVNEHEGISS